MQVSIAGIVLVLSSRDHIQSGRLTDVSARRIIKKRAADTGVDGFISGHSLRIKSRVCGLSRQSGCLGRRLTSSRQMEKLTDARTLRSRRDGRTRGNRKV